MISVDFGVQLRSNFGTTFSERMETLVSADIHIAEIDGKDLLDQHHAVMVSAKANNISISTVSGGYRGWIGHLDKDMRDYAINDIEDILEKCAVIGAKGIVVPASYGMYSTRLNAKAAPRSPLEDETILRDGLSRLNRRAMETGTYVYLEPLNRYEDYMLNTLEQAANLILDAGFSHVKLTADTFHMNIEEKNPAQSIRNWHHLIGHVHVADTNRLQPGLGHFDFKKLFMALEEVHYAGIVIVESSWVGNLHNSLETCMKYLKAQHERW